MYAHIKTKLASCVLVVTLGTLVGTVHAADRNPAQQTMLLVADQSDSWVTIDCPGCDDPFEIRVVTLADIWDTAAESDPDGPQRIATDIYHPYTGELIHINIVEVAIRHLPARSGARARVEIIPNREPAYCRLCDLDALFDDRPLNTGGGGGIIISRDTQGTGGGSGGGVIFGLVPQDTQGTGGGGGVVGYRDTQGTGGGPGGGIVTFRRDRPAEGPVCSICQEPVIEVFVRVDAEARHDGPASYGVKIITAYGPLHKDDDPPNDDGDTFGELDEGGNPGGSPDSNSPDDGGNPGG